MKNLKMFALLLAALFITSNAVNAQTQLEVSPYVGYWQLDETSGETVYGFDLSIVKPVSRKFGLKIGTGFGRIRTFRSRDLSLGYNLLDLYGGIVLHTKDNLKGFYTELLVNPGVTKQIFKVENVKISHSTFNLGFELGLGYKIEISERLNAGFKTGLNIFAHDLDQTGVRLKGALTLNYKF